MPKNARFLVPFNPRHLLLAAAWLFLATGAAWGQTLYGLTFDGGPPGGKGPKLIQIITATGAGTLLGNPNADLNPFGLAFRPSPGNNLFTWDQNNQLFKELDPATGAIVSSINMICTTPRIIGEGDIVFSSGPKGSVGYLSATQGFFNRLVYFDFKNLNYKFIPINIGINGLAFDSTGNLFALSAGSTQDLYLINPLNGNTTKIGNTFSASSYNRGGLAFDSSDKLYAAVGSNSGSNLYLVDPSNGSAKFIGPIGFKNVCGISFQPAVAGPVPSPIPAIILPVAPTNVTEGGPTVSYTVSLTVPPTSNVTVNIQPDGQVTVAPSSLTFTPINFNVPQTVNVTAVDDNLVESSPHPGIITHTASSNDPSYNGLIVCRTVNITDNDVGGPPGININESDGTTEVFEGEATDSYTIYLNSMPTAPVTITLNPGNQLTVSPNTLTFLPGSWKVPQTVIVTAIDDSVVEGPGTHIGNITHSASSADSNYNGLPIRSVTVTITDNDFPGGEGSYGSGPSGGEGSFGFGYFGRFRFSREKTVNQTGNFKYFKSPILGPKLSKKANQANRPRLPALSGPFLENPGGGLVLLGAGMENQMAGNLRVFNVSNQQRGNGAGENGGFSDQATGLLALGFLALAVISGAIWKWKSSSV